MSSEIEVPETPNWLQELEAKRERRLKARLGHEAGAGAPCLKCGDKCPGLDLHFWRKCCKICKCSKEEHEVQDDDIYGWAQFQLLGSKPNKIKRKIALPGKKDEVELDWIPKGHNDTVEKYLKTLPPEQLPVKGSQAAQDRKQLLQKQIPIHDIDPTLCHELSNDELKQMNDYIAHVKQASVGVGQIVSLSNIIKANLHMLNPSEAALIASRYPKGIPLAEIVKLQSQSRANALRQQGLSQKLDKLSLQDGSNKTLPNFSPSSVSTLEENLNPWVSNNVRDVSYPGYTHDTHPSLTNAQFSGKLKPGQNRHYLANNRPDEKIPVPSSTLDERFLQNLNFNPKNIPSQFMQQNVLSGQPRINEQNIPYDENVRYQSGDQPNSAFVPYNKVSSGLRPGENHEGGGTPRNTNYSSIIPGRGAKSPSGYKSGETHKQDTSGSTGAPEMGSIENIDPLDPNFAKNLAKYPSGLKNTAGDQAQKFATPESRNELPYEHAEEMKKNNSRGMPNYVPGKYNFYSETQSPSKIPRNMKDLAFSTYDATDPNSSIPEIPPNQRDALAYENYPPGYNPHGIPSEKYPDYNPDNNSAYDKKLVGSRPGQYGGYSNDPSGNIKPVPSGTNSENRPQNELYNQNIPYGQKQTNVPHTDKISTQGAPSSGLGSGPYARPNVPGTGGDINNQNIPYGQNIPYEQSQGSIPYSDIKFATPDIPSSRPESGQHAGPNLTGGNQGDVYGQNVLYGQYETPYGQTSSGLVPGQYAGPNSPLKDLGRVPGDNTYGQNVAQPQYYPGGNQANVPHRTKPTKKLSEFLPGKINVDEDYLLPSQVNIGAIQDISYPEIKAATQGTNDFYEDYSPDSLREILNNVKLPDCHYCKKPFEENEFAVTIDRANVLFHAQCFKCAGCNQILADNVYFYNKETDNVYCGRDYAKIRGFPRCKACDELIFTKEYCLAENSTFHLKHFCCIECDTPLAGQDYTLEDSMPYCLPCFEQSKASKCSSCGEVIKPDEIGCNLNGVHFHAVDECYACKVCKKPLMGKKLLLRNEKLYCSHDCFGVDSQQ